MHSDLAFFSFVELSDTSQHRTYNEWHQLDHLPENLALPGVAWGDRWMRSDDDKQASVGVDKYAAVDYISMYWFRPPSAESVREWDALGESSFQWGRGPLIPGIERQLLAFFTPVKGYVSPCTRISTAALPLRPNRGLHLTLSRFQDPHSPQTHSAFQWHDRTRIPDLLEVEGVAGAWTFSFKENQRHSTLPFSTSDELPTGALRLRILYLDQDPAEVRNRIHDLETEADSRGRGAPDQDIETVLLSTTVKSIQPWQDW